MKIIKRNGSEETFNIEKIINAIRKANNSADSPFLTEEQITDIADYVEYKCNKIKRAVSVEEIPVRSSARRTPPTTAFSR